MCVNSVRRGSINIYHRVVIGRNATDDHLALFVDRLSHMCVHIHTIIESLSWMRVKISQYLSPSRAHIYTLTIYLLLWRDILNMHVLSTLSLSRSSIHTIARKIFIFIHFQFSSRSFSLSHILYTRFQSFSQHILTYCKHVMQCK